MYRLSYIFSVNVRVQYVHMELRHEGAQHLISVSQPNKAHNITPPRVGPGNRRWAAACRNVRGTSTVRLGCDGALDMALGRGL